MLRGGELEQHHRPLGGDEGVAAGRVQGPDRHVARAGRVADVHRIGEQRARIVALAQLCPQPLQPPGAQAPPGRSRLLRAPRSKPSGAACHTRRFRGRVVAPSPGCGWRNVCRWCRSSGGPRDRSGGGKDLQGDVAEDEMSVAGIARRWELFVADRSELARAAAGEAAAGRRVERARDLAGEADALAALRPDPAIGTAESSASV